jgi:uncharacterized membrane protein YeaQ/YmgE (transglycosylase-associated protein family)
MGICGLLIAGGIIGALARLIVPGKQDMGFWVTVLLGVVGAVVGGLVADWLDAGTLVTWIVGIAVATGLVFGLAGWQRSQAAKKNPRQGA